MQEEPIRVCQVVGKWLGGGVESVVMNYYRHIDRSKVQFDFICDEDSKFIPYEEIKQLGGRIYIVPSYKKLFSFIREVRKVIRQNNYQIVHSHLSTLSIFPLYAAKKEHVPVRIAHSHSTYSWKEFTRTLVKFILKPFSKVYATNYFACSEEAGKFLFGKKAFEKGKINIMYNAIELNSFMYNEEIRNKIRSELNISSDTIVFGHAGRFVKTKNHEFLIDAFNEYHKLNPNSMLLLIGKGELENVIRSKIWDLHLSRSVKFLGFRTDINDLYQAMDIFLLPSLYEGLGMTLIEAQVSGLPCITSNFVPQEANINNKVVFEELDIEKWVNNMKNINIDNRSDVDVSTSGYSIDNEAINLMNKYISYINR